MEISLFANSLQLIASASLPILAGIGTGALTMGFLKAATRIEDTAISLIGRLAGLFAIFLWGSALVSKPIMEFAQRLWSGLDFYY